MRRKTALVLGALAGFLAVVVLLRRRSSPSSVPEPGPLAPAEQDPRAEALRRRLDEARAAAEPDGAQDAPPGDDVEAMRRLVHSEARRAAEEMRRHGAGS